MVFIEVKHIKRFYKSSSWIIWLCFCSFLNVLLCTVTNNVFIDEIIDQWMVKDSFAPVSLIRGE